MKKIRIKCQDSLGNKSFVHNGGGHWQCTLANGINASFHYAGVADKSEAEFRFALEDSTTAEEVLKAVQKFGSPTYVYSVL